jgi:hypothetical protein
MKPASSGKRRIYELDLLRGLFIVIILVDHMQFWPSPFTYITGEGRLWTTAAEGFFLISGLLIGYIRAYKGKKYSLKDLSKKLASRALMLYLWGIGVTLFVLLFTLIVGNHALLPKLPDAVLMSSPAALTGAIFSGMYFSDWIYFLRLYTIMLLITPLFLLAIRKGHEKQILPVLLLTYLISFWLPEAALQWQIYFFSAALIGYRLEQIVAWLRDRPLVKNTLCIFTISLTFITMVLSYYFVHGWGLVESETWFMDRATYVSIRTIIDPWFSGNPVMPGRIVLSFLWFGGLLFTMHYLKSIIMKLLGWLLVPLGERSLSAYILQALILPFVVIIIPIGSSIYNFIASLTVILIIWLILKSKIVKKIIPQ